MRQKGTAQVLVGYCGATSETGDAMVTADMARLSETC
jgi:hypothetical protein